MSNSYFKWTVFLLSIFIGSQCKTYKNQDKAIRDYFSGQCIDFNFEHGLIIIIPMEGCSDCIESTLSYVRNSNILGKGNAVVIISDFYGWSIRKNFPDFENSKKYLIADSVGMMYSLGLVFNSPVVYYYENGTIIKRIVIHSVNIDSIYRAIQAF
ncbi:MAG: hypothetical protein ACP5D1_12680 [Bacteroidales bacterium]